MATGDYSQEYLDKKQADLDRDRRTQDQKSAVEVQKYVDALIELAQEQYEMPLDVNNGALNNALGVLDKLGDQMPIMQLRGYVDQFVGQPAALRTLKAFFETKDMASGVEHVNKYLYEPFMTAISLKTYVDTLSRGGSLNELATEIGKIAQKEGLKFPENGGLIDPAGAEEAMRAAAGLPAAQSENQA